ncbi:MAG: membrane lipoprotein lipid attachment site-containing protein [Caulobacter sp.]|nr:membrane lipoprotein lipid attachment site-containing protein [Caulobacter sp.]
MKRLIVLAVSAALLTACATSPTVYGPQTAPHGAGYSEYRLENGRYRVTFQGNPGAPVNQVSDYVLLRSAELALRDGYDWFRVADRMTEQTGSSSGSSLSIGGGSSSYDYGRHGHGSSVGLGVGTTFNLGPKPAVTSSMEVVFGRGQPPRDANVYDARAIVDTIGRGRAAV